MYFRHMLVVCVIPDLQNPAGNIPTQLFIDSQVIIVVGDFSMISIKELPHMINDPNLMPNK